MRRIMLGLALLASVSAKAEGQVTYSDIIYRGCMPTDPLSCAELRFWFSGPEGLNMWIMDVPAFTGELDYWIRDDMWYFKSFDGKCVSASYFWYRQQDDCAVTYRYSGQWVGQAQIRASDSPEIIDQVPIALTPVVTPEPATMLLVGSGLAGIAAAARRRRRASRETTS